MTTKLVNLAELILTVPATAASFKNDLGLVAVASSGSAGDLVTGTLADARLSPNVALRGASNTFTQSQQISTADGIAQLTVTGAPSGLTARWYHLGVLNGDTPPSPLSSLGAPAAVRVEASVLHYDFEVDPVLPPGFTPSNFAVSWSGFITFDHSEVYTIFGASDDGIRVWIDGQLVVDAWVYRSAASTPGTFTAVAGRSYSLLVEYFQGGGGCEVSLSWSSPSTPSSDVPLNRLTVDGSALGASLTAKNGSTVVAQLGNASALLGGSYDGTAVLYSPGELRVAAGGTATQLSIQAADPGAVSAGQVTIGGGVIRASSSVYANGVLLTSDERKKQNITAVLDGLRVLRALNPVGFDWKESGKRSHGFIAQAVETLIPSAVETGADGFKTMDYTQLLAFIVSAIQELDQRTPA